MGTITKPKMYARDLFKDGRTPSVVKSHCCLCHQKLWVINKKLRGNFCATCSNRADRVAKGIITEEQSDYALWMREVPREYEEWIINGVPHIKTPQGEIYERDEQ